MLGTCTVLRQAVKGMTERIIGDAKTRLTDCERVSVLLEEYRALQKLLLFRLRVMDQRIPAAGGLLGLVLGSVPAFPPATQQLFLLGVPACLSWIAATTLSHARSKEDHLRRIDEIERLVNHIAGEQLMVFQSQHPNRQVATGGRTGIAATLAVSVACLAGLAVCHQLFHGRPHIDPVLAAVYDLYVLAVSGYTAGAFFMLRRYRYRRSPSHPPPPFTAFRTD